MDYPTIFIVLASNVSQLKVTTATAHHILVNLSQSPELPVIDWVKRLKCSQCGSRQIDFVLTGARR